MTPLEFINSIKPKALELYNIYVILPSLTIAQACLESGFGKHSPGNNLFGFKWTVNCGYDFQLLWTKEYENGSYVSVQAKFRKYNSINDSLDDYGKLIGTSKRYKPVIASKDYREACKQIKACGYATGKDYDLNLIKLIEKYKLNELDGDTMNPNDLLTPNFRYKEFFCQGITPPPDDMFQDILMLAIELQKVRSFLGVPIHITSGYRTKEYNDHLIALGYPASANSYHMKGMAVDSKVNSISTRDYALYLMHLTDFMSVGIGNGFVHCDLRDNFTIIHY